MKAMSLRSQCHDICANEINKELALTNSWDSRTKFPKDWNALKELNDFVASKLQI
jgi:hypothetical protein